MQAFIQKDTVAAKGVKGLCRPKVLNELYIYGLVSFARETEDLGSTPGISCEMIGGLHSGVSFARWGG